MGVGGTGVGWLVVLRLPECGDLAVETVDHRLVFHFKRVLKLDFLATELKIGIIWGEITGQVTWWRDFTCSSFEKRLFVIRSSSYSNALIRSSSRFNELRLGNGLFDEMVTDMAVAGDTYVGALIVNNYK